MCEVFLPKNQNVQKSESFENMMKKENKRFCSKTNSFCFWREITFSLTGLTIKSSLKSALKTHWEHYAQNTKAENAALYFSWVSANSQ